MEVSSPSSPFTGSLKRIDQVIDRRSALLSNFEVLTLLRELESDHLAKARTALKIKKEEEAAGSSSTRVHTASEEVLENLRTIEVEVGGFPLLYRTRMLIL